MVDSPPPAWRTRDGCLEEPLEFTRLSALIDERDLELVRLCLDNGFEALAARWPLPTSTLRRGEDWT
jgi:hypothetical protein